MYKPCLLSSPVCKGGEDYYAYTKECRLWKNIYHTVFGKGLGKPKLEDKPMKSERRKCKNWKFIFAFIRRLCRGDPINSSSEEEEDDEE